MGDMLRPIMPQFNGSLRIESRSDRLTGDPDAVMLREVMERSGIVLRILGSTGLQLLGVGGLERIDLRWAVGHGVARADGGHRPAPGIGMGQRRAGAFPGVMAWSRSMPGHEALSTSGQPIHPASIKKPRTMTTSAG